MSQKLYLKQQWTDASGTAVASASPQIGNASSWTLVSGSLYEDGVGGVYSGSSSNGLALNATTASGSNQSNFSVTFNFNTTTGSSSYPGICLCASTGNSDYYYISIAGQTGTGAQYSIGKHQSSSYFAAPSFGQENIGYTPTAGTQLILSGTLTNSGANKIMTVYVATTAAPIPVLIGVWTDTSPITGATNNLSGVIGAGVETHLTGIHTSEIDVRDWTVSAVSPADSSLDAAYSPMMWNVGSFTNGSSAVATILGSEMNFNFPGTSLAIQFDTSRWYYTGASLDNYTPVIAVSVDGQQDQLLQLPYVGGSGNQSSPTLIATQGSGSMFNISGAGPHTCRLTYLISNAYNVAGISRWFPDASGIPPDTVVINDLFIDPGVGSCVGTIAADGADIMLVIGDSISECDYSNQAAIVNYEGVLVQSLANVTNNAIPAGDPRTDYSYRLGQPFGLQTARRALAGTGYVAMSADGDGASGNNQPAVALWKQYWNGSSISIADYNSSITSVVVNMGTNDQSSTFTGWNTASGATSTYTGSVTVAGAIHTYPNSAASVQAAATALYNDLLTELPNAKIFVLIPFGQAPYAESNFSESMVQIITAAVAGSSSPSRIAILNPMIGTDVAASLPTIGNNVPTQYSSDGTHPNTNGHAIIKPAVVAKILAASVGLPGGAFSSKFIQAA